MPEIRTVTTLRSKRVQIERAIADYEKRLDQARADLAHVNAVISLFESAEHDGRAIRPYVDIFRLYKRGEMFAICRAALADGPMDTRQLAQRVLEARRLSAGDKVLVKAVCFRLIHVLRTHRKTRKVIGDTKRRGVIVWRLPAG